MIDAIEQAVGATIPLLVLADVFLTALIARASIYAHLDRCGNTSDQTEEALW